MIDALAALCVALHATQEHAFGVFLGLETNNLTSWTSRGGYVRAVMLIVEFVGLVGFELQT